MRGKLAAHVRQALLGDTHGLCRQLNETPHPLHVMAVLKELRSRPDIAFDVVQRSTLELDSHMLTLLLQTCRDERALSLFYKWKRLQINGVVQTAFLSALSPTLALRAFGERTDWSMSAQVQMCLKAFRTQGRDGLQLALECMQKLHPDGVFPLPVANVLLHGCSKLGAASYGYRLFQSMEHVDCYSVTAMFLLAARIGSEKMAEQIAGRARANEIEMDDQYWISLLKVYAVTRNANRALATLQLIPQPTISHYQLVIGACRNGDVDIAHRILNRIDNPNRMTLLWYLSALEHAKRPLGELLPVVGQYLARQTTPGAPKFKANVALAPIEGAVSSTARAMGPLRSVDKKALTCVTSLLSSFPNAKVRVVGTRIAPEFMREPASDLDIVVLGVDHDPIQALVLVAERMVHSEYKWHLRETAFSAIVPVLRFSVDGDLVEVTCENPLPIRKTKILADWARLPSVAVAVRAVKDWGMGRGADGFTLSLMVIFVAQVQGVATSGEAMLQSFFEFYREFDFANECVSVRLGCRARKRDLDFALAVEDPVLTDKDLLAGLNEAKMLSLISALRSH